jgi:hypothetical protein
MARRSMTIAVRIVIFALLLFAPLLLVLATAAVPPGLPERVEGTLLLVSAIWFFSAILLAPAVIFRDSGSSSGSDGEGEGGGGGGPPPLPLPPAPPRGGIPLPDAEQSATRLRDHDRPARRRLARRRPAREPDRTPARRPARER